MGYLIGISQRVDNSTGFRAVVEAFGSKHIGLEHPLAERASHVLWYRLSGAVLRRAQASQRATIVIASTNGA